jgi:hypothetical protein
MFITTWTSEEIYCNEKFFKVWISVELPQAPEGSIKWTSEDDDVSDLSNYI